MGSRPRVRSVLHCHCVLALRDGPLTRAVQEESQLQEDAPTFKMDQNGGTEVSSLLEHIIHVLSGCKVYVLSLTSRAKVLKPCPMTSPTPRIGVVHQLLNPNRGLLPPLCLLACPSPQILSKSSPYVGETCKRPGS
jgi:hypothetical protein